MEYRASSTVYNKFSNAHRYDGVFTAPLKHEAPSFSTRVEGYRKIFRGSPVSSIMILNVPTLSYKKFQTLCVRV
ncbi:hypothetical protein Csa_005817 [Cucumis sativus]|uniref:Uncharacterized protein n=1 Tax=Cucumis sativus TaxID=3659 RepID=A0A0A0KM50_CUCSA|nr:hypothetical protein Csa_005817 [Cucumis sativus]